MLPYHNSSIMFILHLRDKERAAPHREIPIQNRSVFVFAIYFSFSYHMYYLLFLVAHTISQKGTEAQRKSNIITIIYYIPISFKSIASCSNLQSLSNMKRIVSSYSESNNIASLFLSFSVNFFANARFSFKVSASIL